MAKTGQRAKPRVASINRDVRAIVTRLTPDAAQQLLLGDTE